MKRTVVVGIATLCISGLLRSQNSGPPLSLTDAQALALKNHPQILASQAI